MVRQVCFLISQACQDDLTYETEGRFVRLSEEMDLAGKLRAVLTSPHEDLKAEDIRELVGYTLDRLNEARSEREDETNFLFKLLLNVNVISHAGPPSSTLAWAVRTAWPARLPPPPPPTWPPPRPRPRAASARRTLRPRPPASAAPRQPLTAAKRCWPR